jgi:hypothetical protein
VVSFDTARNGSKMLRRAVRGLLDLDPEADALTDVRVESRQMSSGVFDRSCVTVRANLVRQIPVVTLPAPPGHHHEHP